MDTEVDAEDSEFILFTEPNTSRLTCATPTTPNSNASSPLIMNEEHNCSTQSYDDVRQSNSTESSLCSSSIIFDTKGCTKRGRPRKDFHTNVQRGTNKPLQRRKAAKDAQTFVQFYADNCAQANFDEKQIGIIDESPLIQDNYPGKVCFLCNLSERSSLGQGDLVRYEFGENRVVCEEDINECADACILLDAEQQNSQFRRPKSTNKIKVYNECYNELDKVGHSETLSLLDILDCGYVYVHSMCSSWTLGVRGNIELDSNFVTVISKSLKQKCTYCNQYGASIQCRMSCNKIFHFPCAVAARCFLIRDIFRVFCAEHLNHVHLNCNDSNIDCRHCSTSGDISTLIMCSTCGDHYHNSCVGLADLPDTRSGWNCATCTQCQICKQRDFSDGRLVKCEQCQKVYHSTCLRPIITSIPKYGWKCNRCRVCTDCGSRTPGAGTSSRWHCHYTICDSCYQQRNKGFSCPICHKAYRASAQKEMVKCSSCNRFVHSACDDEADLTNYHNKKENNPDYDYFCPSCKNTLPYEFLTSGEITDIRSLSLSDMFHKDMEADHYEKNEGHMDFSKLSKKRLVFKEFSRSRGGRTSVQRGNMISQFVRKRGTRGKSRHMLSLGSTNFSQNYDRSNRTIDDDLSMEKKIILCSMKDKFILSQDICVMCGSIGCNGENYTISCSQCGQCFHPYCVNIKVSDVILKKGWRCLDCTACEGCGLKNDESRLLLCDECDISFHIYCISPPLDSVPLGNWKCSWCAICQKCGKSASLNDSNWLNGYLECGVCISEVTCFVCLLKYEHDDVIIQCNICKKWLHKCCDTAYDLKNNLNEFADYSCIVCRSKDDTSYQQKNNLVNDDSSIKSDLSIALSSEALKDVDKSGAAFSESSDNNGILHTMDGISVTDTGLNMIKGLTTEIRRKRKIRLSNDFLSKKSDNLSVDPLIDNGKDISDEKLANALLSPSENFKDGMIWVNMDKTPPDGFIIAAGDDGKHVLRKKRQRNLQKLGIGGFNVRNRANKKENEAHDAIANELNALDVEKKRKNRKKLKWKLTESFPAYLQEAFFGKSLLASNDTNVSLCESDSSGENKNEVFNIFDVINKPNKEITESNKTHIDIESEQKKKIQQIISDSIDGIKTEIPEEKMNPRNVFENSMFQKSFRDSPTWNLLTTKSVDTSFNSPATAIETSSNKYMGDMQMDRSISKVQNGDTDINKQDQIQIGIMNQEQLNNMPIISIMTSQKQDQTLEMKPKPLQFQETNNNEDRSFLQVKNVEPASVGTQKTAEKMRHDEDLGTMATISAVLYANTVIPELKDQYPNWSDRCKQILKKWRSLPTEKKAPFLQNAKDNRSALRTRKIKELDKIDLQKPEKEQEQEKMWKQHKAKKEGLLNRALFKVGSTESIPACSTSQTAFKTEIEALNSDHKTNKFTSEYNSINSGNTLQTENRINQISQEYGKQGQKSPYIYQNLYNTNTKVPPNAFQVISPNSEFVLQNQKVMNVVQNHTAFNVNKSDLEITDSNTADNPDVPMPCEIDRLEHDENVGFGDILKGIGDGDDDDLLESLTTEVGDDFNILEYADPELDELVTNQNLLHKLDFGDGEKNT